MGFNLQVAAVADLAFAENAAAVQAGFTVTLQASFFGASGTVMQFTETADASLSKVSSGVYAQLGTDSSLTILYEEVLDVPVDWQNSGGACSSLSSPGNGGDFRETIQHTFTVFTEELPLYEVLTVSIALLLNLDIQVALSQCTASGRPMLGVAGAFGGDLGASGGITAEFIVASATVAVEIVLMKPIITAAAIWPLDGIFTDQTLESKCTTTGIELDGFQISIYTTERLGWGETYIAADGSDTPEADFPKTCSSYTPLAMFPGDSVFIASDSSRQSSVYAGSPYRPNTDCTWELELPPYSVLSCGECPLASPTSPKSTQSHSTYALTPFIHASSHPNTKTTTSPSLRPVQRHPSQIRLFLSPKTIASYPNTTIANTAQPFTTFPTPSLPIAPQPTPTLPNASSPVTT
ncbi:MAG: hypothetical protein WDW38_003832 [Sanguina aurantia]